MAPTLPCLVRSFVMLLDARCHEDPHGTTMDPVYLHVLKYIFPPSLKKFLRLLLEKTNS